MRNLLASSNFVADKSLTLPQEARTPPLAIEFENECIPIGILIVEPGQNLVGSAATVGPPPN
jgi:hypothetical protein